MFKPLLSKIMIEAHANAKADFVWSKANDRAPKAYSYFLGLRMRCSYAEARVALTGKCPSFELPAQRWY